jgi:urate oxidase
VSIVQAPWERIEAGGAPHRHAFVAGGGGRRTATVTRAGGQAWVVAGLADLLVLKTTGSGFEGFLKDGYTTLAETDDRILATVLEASWRYATLEVDWAEAVAAVRRLLLETFAGHDESRSVQHTLWAMGQAVLDQRPEVADRPFGLIEGTVTRDDAPPAGRAWE